MERNTPAIDPDRWHRLPLLSLDHVLFRLATASGRRLKLFLCASVNLFCFPLVCLRRANFRSFRRPIGSVDKQSPLKKIPPRDRRLSSMSQSSLHVLAPPLFFKTKLPFDDRWFVRVCHSSIERNFRSQSLLLVSTIVDSSLAPFFALSLCSLSAATTEPL